MVAGAVRDVPSWSASAMLLVVYPGPNARYPNSRWNREITTGGRDRRTDPSSDDVTVCRPPTLNFIGTRAEPCGSSTLQYATHVLPNGPS